MVTIDRNDPPTDADVELFLASINFQLPQGFIAFYKETNGADVKGNEKYVILWPLTDLIQSNRNYNVDLYAPGFFIFGSDGGGIAYTIERKSGYIFEMPFIGMSDNDAVLIGQSFNEFLDSI